MVEMNGDVKTMGIAINLQRMFNPLVEPATMRLQDPQTGNLLMAAENMNVSFSAIFLNKFVDFYRMREQIDRRSHSEHVHHSTFESLCDIIFLFSFLPPSNVRSFADVDALA